MEQLYPTTQSIGIKDKHITLDNVFKCETHIEVYARISYLANLL
ncbi:hypothetical protein [Streptococcus halichoeri]|nr:hypothetical protein [Streptococcus halichoeri]